MPRKTPQLAKFFSIQIIGAAIRRINSIYGRGDVVSIEALHEASRPRTVIGGRVNIKKQYGTEKPSFRIEGSTLYFRGHQFDLTRKIE